MDFEKIKLDLLDPNYISNKQDTKGRQAIDAEISQIRIQIYSINEQITNKTNAIEEQEKRIKELSALKTEKTLAFEQQLKTIPAQIKKLFKIKDKSATEIQIEIKRIEAKINETTSQTCKLVNEIEQLIQSQTKISDPEKIRKEYFNTIETIPLPNEDKRKLLHPDILTNLNTEEYIKLWRRLNPYFISHITRQGFRDHYAMMYHSGGIRKFNDGFLKILQDQKSLKPPIAASSGLYARDKKTIHDFLKKHSVLKAENKEEAKKRLYDQLNYSEANAPYYPDKTAVHFAAQIVADEHYGGESNNEIFIIYPSDFIASQYDYAFNGYEKDFTKPQSEDKWNDVFIWPPNPDNPNIPIDAGLVFLPEDTLVDSATGSKYDYEIQIIKGKEQRVMIEDQKIMATFIDWFEKLNEESPLIQTYKEYIESNNNMYIIFEKEFLKKCREEITKLGFDEHDTANISYKLFIGLNHSKYKNIIGDNENKKDTAIKIIREANANWAKAKNKITAKKYWETYFEKNPNQKPKHLVFYKGKPTTAVKEFLDRNKIGQANTTKVEGKLLGFDDRHVYNMKKDPRAKRGYNELIETAHIIIEEHYKTQQS